MSKSLYKSRSMGTSVAFADQVRPRTTITARLENETAVAFDRLERLTGRAI